MPKSDRDDDETFQEQPRPRPPQRPAPSQQGVRRKPPLRPGGAQDEDDDRPRRKRPPGDEEGGDALSTLIPYKNVYALIGYYCGMLALIVILGGFALGIAAPRVGAALLVSLVFGLGGLLALMAFVLGLTGIMRVSNNPQAKGTGHAIFALVLGILEILGLLVLLVIGSTAIRI